MASRRSACNVRIGDGSFCQSAVVVAEGACGVVYRRQNLLSASSVSGHCRIADIAVRSLTLSNCIQRGHVCSINSRELRSHPGVLVDHQALYIVQETLTCFWQSQLRLNISN